MSAADAVPGGSGYRPAAKKSPWTSDEDAVLREQVRLHGPHNWDAISAALQPGRNAKSCRLRWRQHLAPDVDAGRPFTADEDAAVVAYHRRHPNKWATIAAFLPGRTDNDVKNRWNSFLRKQQRVPAPPRRPNGMLLLFPLAPGDVRATIVGGAPVLRLRPPPPEEDECRDDRSGACLWLFPLAPGDIVRGNNAREAAMDVDAGAGDPVTELMAVHGDG